VRAGGRAIVEAKIAERVPMPTAEDRAAARPPTDREREAEEEDRARAADEERRINRAKAAQRRPRRVSGTDEDGDRLRATMDDAPRQPKALQSS